MRNLPKLPLILADYGIRRVVNIAVHLVDDHISLGFRPRQVFVHDLLIDALVGRSAP